MSRAGAAAAVLYTRAAAGEPQARAQTAAAPPPAASRSICSGKCGRARTARYLSTRPPPPSPRPRQREPRCTARLTPRSLGLPLPPAGSGCMAEESAEGGAAPQSVPTAGQHPQAMPPPPPAEQAQGCMEPPVQLGAADRWQQASPADRRGPVCRVPGCAEPLTQLYNMVSRPPLLCPLNQSGAAADVPAVHVPACAMLVCPNSCCWVLGGRATWYASTHVRAASVPKCSRRE